MRTRQYLALTVAFASATVSGAALAQSAHPLSYGDVPVERVVRYGDLDLSSDSGARRLAGRIRLAAEIACTGAVADIHPSSGPRGCVKTAIERSAATVNNRLVDAHLGLARDGVAFARNR
jgi:UrcA family protein